MAVSKTIEIHSLTKDMEKAGMLCYLMLCYVILYYVMLCYVMLYCDMSCYVMLRYVTCAILYNVIK